VDSVAENTAKIKVYM